jgi:hypothetical protein
MFNTAFLINALGWLGAVIYLTAFALTSFDKLNSTSITFQVTCIISGMLLTLNTLYKEVYASAILNIIWMLICQPPLFADTKNIL